MATIIGVFDNDADLERALNQLHAAGFEDDIRVVDPARLSPPNVSDETLLGGIGAVNSPASSGSGTPLPAVVPAFINQDELLTGENITGILSDYDLTAEEADYYADRAQKGSRLLIVRAEDEHHNFISEIMRRAHAQQWTGKDTR